MNLSQLISKLTMIQDMIGGGIPVTVQGGTEDTDRIPFCLNVWVDGFKMGLSFDVTADETDSNVTAVELEKIRDAMIDRLAEANRRDDAARS